VKGNISYGTREIEGTHINEAGEEVARWETTRIIIDPEEHEAAIKTRSKARSMIKTVCAQSAFGQLCPEDRAPELIAAIAEARALAQRFNEQARLTRLSVNVIFGRIAQDDVEAVRAISAELRDLMEDMQQGLANLDVKQVRDAAAKAKQIGEMLSPAARERLEEAVKVARSSATKMAKAGEQVGIEIDKVAIEQIDKARVSFLDIEDEVAIGTPDVDVRGLDLTESMYENIQYGGPATPELEMDDSAPLPEGWDEITETAPGMGDDSGAAIAQIRADIEKNADNPVVVAELEAAIQNIENEKEV
jgi:hypothetical protein